MASILAVAFLPFLQAIPAHAAGGVTLQNATATCSQGSGPFPVSTAIDGNTTTVVNGWAIFCTGVSNAETAAFETAADLTTSTLTFTFFQNLGSGHELGRFRLSATADARSTFADGLQDGGDVTANWTVLDPSSAASVNGATLTEKSDHSILASGALPATDLYTVVAPAPFGAITGFRLEAMLDPSLPTSGPGRQPGNGNFVLTELKVSSPIQVDTTAESASDGFCSLREAIQAANTDTAVDTCPAGSGADIVALPAGSYVLGGSELTITAASDVTIAGAGAATSTIDGNNASRILHNFGTLALSGLTLTRGNDAGQGAAVFDEGAASRLSITDSVLTTNQSDSSGGAISTDTSSQATITNSSLTGNAAAQAGGAIDAHGPLTIVGSTLSGNAGQGLGGAIRTNSSISITRSTLFGNTVGSSGQGAAVLIEGGGTGTLTSSTVSTNAAASGGGGLSGGSWTVTDSTIAGNTSGTGFGGGLHNLSASLRGTILADNSLGECSATTLTSLGHNLIEDLASCPGITGDTATNVTGLDPGLGPILDNGGRTETLAITAASPAFDAGVTGVGCSGTDQRGVPRPQGAACDIGSFEVPVCTITSSGIIHGTKGNDTICGGAGADTINGQAGNDVILAGAGNDKILPGKGDDLVYGQGGTDSVGYYDSGISGVMVDLSASRATGSGGYDSIFQITNVNGSPGDDTITGNGSANVIDGRQGNDTISGGPGNDNLVGGPGNDVISGDQGSDQIEPNGGANTLDGGPDSDTLRYDPAPSAVTLTLPTGVTSGGATDSFANFENARGSAFADTLSAPLSGVASLLTGNGGIDSLNTQDGDALDTMNGGAGSDSCIDAGDGDTLINC